MVAKETTSRFQKKLTGHFAKVLMLALLLWELELCAGLEKRCNGIKLLGALTLNYALVSKVSVNHL